MNIDEFSGQYDWLSNFYPSPIVVETWIYPNVKNISWPTVEHYYQAMKTPYPAEQDMIRNAATPGRAKRLGRQVNLRADWDDIRVTVMVKALCTKFTQHQHLGLKLLQTGDAFLVEGNSWHDNYWGACTCPKCVDKPKKNMLGGLLMWLRESLKTALESEGDNNG